MLSERSHGQLNNLSTKGQKNINKPHRKEQYEMVRKNSHKKPGLYYSTRAGHLITTKSATLSV